MTYTDIQNDLKKMKEYSFTIIDDDAINTKNVMREETELLLQKQRTIYNILIVTTLVSVFITIKYVQN